MKKGGRNWGWGGARKKGRETTLERKRKKGTNGLRDSLFGQKNPALSGKKNLRERNA